MKHGPRQVLIGGWSLEDVGPQSSKKSQESIFVVAHSTDEVELDSSNIEQARWNGIVCVGPKIPTKYELNF